MTTNLSNMTNIRNQAQSELDAVLSGGSVKRAMAVAQLQSVVLKTLELEIQAAQIPADKTAASVSETPITITPKIIAKVAENPLKKAVIEKTLTEKKKRVYGSYFHGKIMILHMDGDIGSVKSIPQEQRSTYKRIPYSLDSRLLDKALASSSASALIGYSADWLTSCRGMSLVKPDFTRGNRKFFIVRNLIHALINARVPFAINENVVARALKAISHE